MQKTDWAGTGGECGRVGHVREAGRLVLQLRRHLRKALFKINHKQFRKDVVAGHRERGPRILSVLGGFEQIPQPLVAGEHFVQSNVSVQRGEFWFHGNNSPQ